MKFPVSIIICIFSCSFLTAQTTVKSKTFNIVLKTIISSKVPEISVSDAFSSFNNYLFIDAREPEEFNVSHIRNAKFVGYKKITLNALKDVPKSKPIVVYCAVGKRSENITKKLTAAGFINVYNLYGGIFEWVNQDHPVYNNLNNLTDSVHAYDHFWGQFLNKGKKVY